MKIAIVCGIFFPIPGGAQVQVHNTANKLVEFGHEVDVFLYNPTDIRSNDYKTILISKFLSSLVFFFKYYLKIDLSFIFEIYFKKIIKKSKYDIWHFNLINFKSLLIINTLKKLNQKIVVTFHGVDLQIDRKINYGYRLDKKYEECLLENINNIDLFLNISSIMKKDLLSLGIDENKIIHLPNTIDINKINRIKGLNKKIDAKKLKLITVARYDKNVKGYNLVETVAKKLFDNNVNFLWTIIGQSTKRLNDKKFIKENKDLFNIIENIGNEDEKYFPNTKIIKEYFNSDIYVNLSRIESFGVTFIEAIASGLPIISFDSKGANEIIVDDYNGFLITSDSLDDYVNKLIQISNNKNLLDSKRYNLTKTIERYDLNVVTNQLIDIFKNI